MKCLVLCFQLVFYLCTARIIVLGREKVKHRPSSAQTAAKLSQGRKLALCFILSESNVNTFTIRTTTKILFSILIFHSECI